MLLHVQTILGSTSVLLYQPLCWPSSFAELVLADGVMKHGRRRKGDNQDALLSLLLPFYAAL